MLSQIRDTMEHKGFKAQIMEAERLTGDYVHELPQGKALSVYHADMFEKWPEQWLKGRGVFLAPVRPNKGLWFNWRMNSEVNTAVLPTVKGCNPITGMQTSGFHLERYFEKCPKHGCSFEADRYCPECKYKWPDRNYASMAPLWVDGFFNNKDGTVRQFFFTEDELRDVATHMIGRDNTVPAFGFAFYSPKEPRPEPVVQERWHTHYDPLNTPLGHYEPFPKIYPSGTGDGTWWTYTNTSGDIGIYTCDNSDVFKLSGGNNSAISAMNVRSTTVSCCSTSPVAESFSEKALRLEEKINTKEVSIGAGAKIRQALNHDPYDLDSWKEAPDAVMTIYFVFQEKLEELLKGGVRDIEGKPEGMLEGVPVG